LVRRSGLVDERVAGDANQAYEVEDYFTDERIGEVDQGGEPPVVASTMTWSGQMSLWMNRRGPSAGGGGTWPVR
jgi:hypothetical protein